MKILRKNDDFRKMPEKSVQDVLIINNLINQGWNYCSKQIYKEFHGATPAKEKAEDGSVIVKSKKSKKKSKI